MREYTKKLLLSVIAPALWFILIASWVIIVGFDININHFLDIIQNIWLVILLIVLIFLTIILIIKYKIKFILIVIAIIASTRLIGKVALYGWIIYGIYRLWILDQKDEKNKK